MTQASEVQKVKCAVCQAEFPLSEYSAHVESAHSKPKDSQAPQTTRPPATSAWDNWNAMPSSQFRPVSGRINARDMSGGHYLKGSDVPVDATEVKFKIIQFVIDPKGRSQLACIISDTYGKTMFGFNTTNIRQMLSLGYEDMQAAVGKTIVCQMGWQPNPQNNGMPSRALFVYRVE